MFYAFTSINGTTVPNKAKLGVFKERKSSKFNDFEGVTPHCFAAAPAPEEPCLSPHLALLLTKDYHQSALPEEHLSRSFSLSVDKKKTVRCPPRLYSVAARVYCFVV